MDTMRERFAAATLRAATTGDLVLVEPYLSGTSVPFATETLHDLPHRILGLGTAREELRRYGSRQEHVAAHGLDTRGLRERISAFLTAPR